MKYEAKPLTFTVEDMVNMALRSESQDIMSKVVMMIECESRWTGLVDEDKKQLDRLDEAIKEQRRKDHLTNDLEWKITFLTRNVEQLEKQAKEALKTLKESKAL